MPSWSANEARPAMLDGELLRVERLQSPADLDAVMAIEEASFNNPTARGWYDNELLRPEVCHIYVLKVAAAENGPWRILAFCAFWLVVDQIHINNFAVHPDHRSRGYGRALLAHILEQADRLGAATTTLEVRRSNIAARRLYESAGFRVVGVRTSYYTNPIEDALILTRAGGRVPDQERAASRTHSRREAEHDG
jgi:[ribosomal protein S18]-alanine N-acetyltransferase